MEITSPYGVRPFGIISLTPFKPRKLLNYELRLKVTHRDAVWLELGLSWFCHDNSNENDNNIVTTIWWDNNSLGLSHQYNNVMTILTIIKLWALSKSIIYLIIDTIICHEIIWTINKTLAIYWFSIF